MVWARYLVLSFVGCARTGAGKVSRGVVTLDSFSRMLFIKIVARAWKNHDDSVPL